MTTEPGVASRRNWSLLFVALMTLTVHNTPALGQVQFVWIDLPDGAVSGEVWAVSDGQDPTIVGSLYDGAENGAFRWRASDGFGRLPSSGANGVSADGSVVIGTRRFPPQTGEAFRWSDPSGVVGIGSSSYATCVTADGSTVFGVLSPGSYFSFRWGEAIEELFTGTEGLALVQACNVDGSWLALDRYPGADFGIAARWSAGTGIEPIGDLPGGELMSHPAAISDDGQIVVGTSWSAAAQAEAFRWTPGSGMVGLGLLPGQSTSQALGMSADGSMIVGAAGPHGMVWDSTHGMRSFQTMLLQDYSVDLGAAHIGEIRAISRSGTNMAGWGHVTGQPVRLWLAHLEPCCTPSDMNCDLQVDIADLAVFLAHFGSCSVDPEFWPRADIDRRGCVDLADLSQLLASFGSSCR